MQRECMCVLLYNYYNNSLEYLKRIIGPRTVPVELGSRYTDDGWSQKLMTVNEFIREYIEVSIIIISVILNH